MNVCMHTYAYIRMFSARRVCVRARARVCASMHVCACVRLCLCDTHTQHAACLDRLASEPRGLASAHVDDHRDEHRRRDIARVAAALRACMPWHGAWPAAAAQRGAWRSPDLPRPLIGLTPPSSDCAGTDWARPAHICTGTDWAHPAHICAGTVWGSRTLRTDEIASRLERLLDVARVAAPTRRARRVTRRAAPARW